MGVVEAGIFSTADSDFITVLGRLLRYDGEYDRALCFARQQIDIDPFQEQPHQQVMRLLALTGQRAAALAQYETLKYLLDKEMCMAPAAKTSALHQKILVGDLDMAEAATPSVRGYELQEQIGLGHHGWFSGLFKRVSIERWLLR